MIMAKQHVTICVSECLLVCLLGLFVCLLWMVTICVSETKVRHCCDNVCICVFAWMVAWIVCLSLCIVVLYYCCMFVCAFEIFCVDCLFAAASVLLLVYCWLLDW